MSAPSTAAPSFETLIRRVFEQRPAFAFHGRGLGRQDADDEWSAGEFAFTFEPPSRWRLDRPPGTIRAVGDDRREVGVGRDGVPRRNAVGAGWNAEAAIWLLRLPLRGITVDQWLGLVVAEAPAAEAVAGRPCWRVALAAEGGTTRMWFDAELPILLRFSPETTGDLPPETFAEVTELRVGSTGPYPVEHDLLSQRLHVPLAPTPADADGLLRRIRSAVPDAISLQLCAWDGDGTVAALMVIPTAHGDAEMLVDRRARSALPYEGTHAALARGGDARWTVSLDHDPEIDEGYARDLAKRLGPLLSGS
ncbi:hypothetical protein [Kribbella sp. C-35]|uniref:hypothetical protein n=1 Tax=Kribbella sp. C-35 TaxID=2789276 RepID=UPI00397A4CB0